MTSSPPPPYTAGPIEDGANNLHMNLPPPLPPRTISARAPKPALHPSIMAMSSHDPRSSSTQSLVPDPAVDNTGLRRLLLVYIHGFMGNETSFRSFPAHVHNLVTVTLAGTHVIHTKIYPRYRSRNALEVARDDFSRWLAPHEDQWTDVILLGHSMGGLLAADVALAFRHRIIGVINFDVPFLGMHPGIVKAGLGSIFNPPPVPEDAPIAEGPQDKKPSRIGTLFNPKPNDPNYNPSFHNDVRLPVRKGWENTLHWVSKHYANGLRQATKGLVKSHLEFGGAMADYKELKDRYARIRALEEDEEPKRRSANPQFATVPRVRFVNYYTVSTGRPKKPKSPKSTSPSRPATIASSSPTGDIMTRGSASQSSLAKIRHDSTSQSPRISIEVQEYRGNQVVPVKPQEPPSATTPSMIRAPTWDLEASSDQPDLPEIPPIPQEPPFVDLMEFKDKTRRRAAEQEHEEALKEYQKAIQARNKIINERIRLEEDWEESQKKEASRLDSTTDSVATKTTNARDGEEAVQVGTVNDRIEAMRLTDSHADEVQSNHPYSNYSFSRSAILSQPTPEDEASTTESIYTTTTTDSNHTNTSSADVGAEPSTKKKKLRKFCMLPPKDAQGNKDPTWIKVQMEDMDEVTAHTSLFFISKTYERLVGDVGARVEEWVLNADSARLAREMEAMN